MRVSKVIKQLQQAQKEHGDLHVTCYDGEYGIHRVCSGNAIGAEEDDEVTEETWFNWHEPKVIQLFFGTPMWNYFENQ